MIDLKTASARTHAALPWAGMLAHEATLTSPLVRRSISSIFSKEGLRYPERYWLSCELLTSISAANSAFFRPSRYWVSVCMTLFLAIC